MVSVGKVEKSSPGSREPRIIPRPKGDEDGKGKGKETGPEGGSEGVRYPIYVWRFGWDRRGVDPFEGEAHGHLYQKRRVLQHGIHSRLPSSTTARTCHRRHKGLVLLRNPYHSGQPRWWLLPTAAGTHAKLSAPPRSCRGGGRADERAGLEVVSLRAAAGGPPRTAEEGPWLWTGQGFACPRFGSAGSEWPVKRSTLKHPCQSSSPVAAVRRSCRLASSLGATPVSKMEIVDKTCRV